MSFPRYPEYKDSGVEWLGEVPGHWELLRVRQVATLNPSKSEVAALPPETELSFLPMEAIGEDGRLDLQRTRPILEVSSGYTYFRDGDVTIAKITPCFENGKGAVICGLVGGAGFGTTELIVARPKPEETTSEYLHWVFVSQPFRKLGEASMYGAGGQKRVPDDFVRDFRLAFPPLREQCAISAFLDRETAKIDALVAEQQNLIALLKEKRQALISHAVTKGLDPDVRMKDSGVAWLGEVPAHWVVLALSRIATERCDGPFGSGIKSEHYTDSGALVVRLQNIRSNGFYVGEPAFLEFEYFEQELKRHEVVPGDVLIAGLGDENNVVGRACVAPAGISPALVKADCFRFRLDGGVVAAAFVAAQLNVSAVADAGRLANGSTRSRIPLSVMATRVIALPSLAEQVEIVAFAERERAAIDELINEAETTIALLRERRTALISAAVTGKIDVRHLSVASTVPTPEPA